MRKVPLCLCGPGTQVPVPVPWDSELKDAEVTPIGICGQEKAPGTQRRTCWAVRGGRPGAPADAEVEDVEVGIPQRRRTKKMRGRVSLKSAPPPRPRQPQISRGLAGCRPREELLVQPEPEGRMLAEFPLTWGRSVFCPIQGFS